MSEALILESVNPQYDERLFIEFPEKYKIRTCCVQILFWMSKQKQKNIFVHNMFLTCVFRGIQWTISCQLSYCGLTYARKRDSEKDLPVLQFVLKSNFCDFRLHFKSKKNQTKLWLPLSKTMHLAFANWLLSTYVR